MTTEQKEGPLSGIRVIDLTRLAPGPYCTMLLADLGAEVIVVAGGRAGVAVPELSRGKRFVSLDLKSDAGREALARLCDQADVVIEGFRPGVASRIGADPDELRRRNPRLVYCSLTGYGQDGPRGSAAGHDINYLGLSGAMGAAGPAGDRPYPPLNLLADFGGGGLLAAFGIVAAIVERQRTGQGQKIDAAMIDGCVSMMAMHYPLWKSAVMPARGEGLITGSAPFYRTYACQDGRFVAVGALERAFFVSLWAILELGEPPDHMNTGNWPAIEAALGARFMAADRDHWAVLFMRTDACVTPVLEPHEVWDEPQVRSRLAADAPRSVPVVPKFERVAAAVSQVDMSDRTQEVLAEFGLEAELIARVRSEASPAESTGLQWPPQLS
ncbi:CaiB/BaiF CoA-transferase family protein [Variovorax sp. J22P168]|uniref:CaiB/BaiF CoA transferase family protein n=1 Tax=Variovorax jilinensis TaxID=3053513 RepID=UPI002578C7AF|nr:CaiB/BaiF CoA-transferase family protein [Variovorax sp. J22P168]MDM0014920.1 CaiB/BaiF CoA-transferase family protein [Variovorax sp. J22P168]